MGAPAMKYVNFDRMPGIRIFELNENKAVEEQKESNGYLDKPDRFDSAVNIGKNKINA